MTCRSVVRPARSSRSAPDLRATRDLPHIPAGLTGWHEHEQAQLPFPEFAAERDAAEAVKREQPILVVLGNPPYNGFAGVSGREKGGLVEPYKVGLAEDWGITKNKLDDLTSASSASRSGVSPSRPAAALSASYRTRPG